MEVGGQRYPPATLPPGKDPVPILGGSVGPRAGLVGCGKSRHPPGFDRRTVQPVASSNADCPRYDTDSTKKRRWTLPHASLFDLWKSRQISLKTHFMSFYRITSRKSDYFPNAFPIQNFLYISSLPKF